MLYLGTIQIKGGIMETVKEYLSALIKTTGRLAIPENKLVDLLSIRSEKLFRAYNLADGAITQAEICKKLKIDSSNFSKAVAKWINSGAMFKINDKLLHLYPLSEEALKTIKKGKKEKK